MGRLTGYSNYPAGFGACNVDDVARDVRARVMNIPTDSGTLGDKVGLDSSHGTDPSWEPQISIQQ